MTAEDGTTTKTYEVVVTRRAVPARIISKAFTSDPGADGKYITGDTIVAEITFDKDVVVTGNPRFVAQSMTDVFFGTFSPNHYTYDASMSDSDTMVFTLGIRGDLIHDETTDLRFRGGLVSLGGATVTNADDTEVDANLSYAGFNHPRSDGETVKVNPRMQMTSLEHVPTLPVGRTIYILGDVLRFRATFPENVTVTGNSGPYVYVFFNEEGIGKTAEYKSGSGTTELIFEYEFTEDDNYTNRRVIVRPNHSSLRLSAIPIGLQLGDGDITASSDSRRVVYRHDLVDLLDLTIDTLGPVPDSGTVNAKSVALTFNEDIDTASVPDKTAFTVTATDSNSNSEDIEVTAVAISSTNVTLTLAASVLTGDEVTVSYAKPMTNPLKDTLGNESVDFTDQEIADNNTTGSVTVAFPSVETQYASEDGVPATFTVTLNKQVRALNVSAVLLRLGRSDLHGDVTAPESIAFEQNTTTMTFDVVATTDTNHNENAD